MGFISCLSLDSVWVEFGFDLGSGSDGGGLNVRVLSNRWGGGRCGWFRGKGRFGLGRNRWTSNGLMFLELLGDVG